MAHIEELIRNYTVLGCSAAEFAWKDDMDSMNTSLSVYQVQFCIMTGLVLEALLEECVDVAKRVRVGRGYTGLEEIWILKSEQIGILGPKQICNTSERTLLGMRVMTDVRTFRTTLQCGL